MSLRQLRTAALFLVLSVLLAPITATAQVSLTTLGSAYTQNFDTLPSSGSTSWANNSTITGWYSARTGTGTTIVADAGSGTGGNLYSYGIAAATDRALGSIGSGNAAAGSFFWGVRLQNNTGSTINSLAISYVGEQWRSSAAAAQTVAFSYLVGSPSVSGSLSEFQTAGTAVTSLNFTSPITGGTSGALNGNLTANRTAISYTITGLSIPNGAEIMLRWSDPDHPGTDHGLAIDDFSVIPDADTTAPTVASVAVPSNATYIAGQTLDFVVTFSEVVVVDNISGVPALAITLDNPGSVPATYVSGSGTANLLFRYTVAAGNSDPNGITVGALALNLGTIKDLAGNDANLTLNSVGSTTNVLVDGIAPTISSVTPPSNATYGIGQPLDFTVNFSEAATVTGTPTLPLTIGSTGVNASYVSGSGTSALVFRYTVASGNADSDGITVGSPIAGTIKDAAGNAATLTVPSLTTSGILVDGIAPTVISIDRGPTATPTNVTSVDFLLKFSEDVTGGVDSGDFTLTTTGTSTGTIGTVTTVNPSTYSVAVTSITGDGTIRLDLKSSGTGITDVAANPISGGFTGGQTYTIDQTAPAVTTVGVPTDGTYAAGQNLDFTVNFGEAVAVSGTPRIAVTLNTGGTVYATWVSGTVALLFRYTVAAGNADPDGITLGSAIDLNGGSLKDAAGNDALLVLNSVGSTTGVRVDAAAPSVSSVVRIGSTPTKDPTVDFTVTFSTSVTGVDTSDFAITAIGVTGAFVSGVSGSGSTYTVTVNTGSGDGTIRLDLKATGTGITNGSGTPIATGFTSGDVFTIDKTAPTVSSITRVDASPSNAASVHFTVTFPESVTGVDAGDFALASTGVTGAAIGGVTGSGSTYTVTVTTGTGDGSIRLDLNATATGIIDAAGNAISGGFATGQSYAIDKTAPTVSSITRVGSSPTNAASIQYTVTFSESVSGVDAADFALTNSVVAGSSITNVTGSGTTWTVTVDSGTGDGTIRLDVPATATIIDAVGNAFTAAFTTGTPYTIDKTAPTVTIAIAVTSPSSAATVDFTVTFSESVTGVTSSVFGINAAAAVTGTSIASMTGSGTTYTVTVNTGTGNGTLGLNLTNGAVVTDAVGNPAVNTTGATYTMQGTPSAPTGLTALAGNAHVALTWTAQTAATSYSVKRATTGGGPYTSIAASVPVANYDDTTAANGTAYYYVVSATGARGTSADSSEVSGTPAAPAPAGNVVISQVYGGGGNAGSVYKNDFIELFNPGSSTVSLVGWSVQYASAAGTSWQSTPLTGSIAPGQYYLVQESAGAGGTTALPTPDATGPITMSGTAAKVALINTTTLLSGGCPTGVIDFVGYGTANCFEGSGPTPAPSNSNAVFRGRVDAPIQTTTPRISLQRWPHRGTPRARRIPVSTILRRSSLHPTRSPRRFRVRRSP